MASAPPREIAVVVSTYDRPDALEAVLASLGDQAFRRFVVVVADDGSGSETREVVERVAQRAPFPVRHVWQEDRGYRLAAIRNRAAAAVESDYLVFMDGDCVVQSDYLDRHAWLAEVGRFVHGSRVRLDRELTEDVLEDRLPIHRWRAPRWLVERLRGRVDRFSPFLRLPLGPLRGAAPQRWKGAKGGNLGVWRADFLAVNGLDEAYEGWGLEDNDLIVRLIRSGVFRKEGRYAIPVLHLWHEQRSLEEHNLERFEHRLQSNVTRAERGLDQYL